MCGWIAADVVPGYGVAQRDGRDQPRRGDDKRALHRDQERGARLEHGGCRDGFGIARRIQPVDATVWLNISAGVW